MTPRMSGPGPSSPTSDLAPAVGEYVLKVHGRCNLACDHCYVYEHADQSWRSKPAAISPETASRAAWRMAEHAAARGLDRVTVVLHGGEPLLIGHEGLRAVLRTLRTVIEPVARLELGVHTNGVLLDERHCELFEEYGVKVGVSLDGDRSANDLHRRYKDGRTSHPEVRSALALLREHPSIYSGILCTVDLRNDPIAVYEALVAERPPHVDLILPHATWDDPPVRPDGVAAPYAAWLGRIHDRWVADGRRPPLRLFDSIRSAAGGGPSWSEAIGVGEVGLLVIDTDGSWEQTDSLKTAYDGAPQTGMNVVDHSVDMAAGHSGVQSRRVGIAGLSATCRACEVVSICGGGLYSHRYKSGSGFDNPSVYCADLKELVQHVAASVEGPRHALPGDAVGALASGPGTAEVLTGLRDPQLSIGMALAAEVAKELDHTDEEAAEGWALLCALDRERPDVVRELLAAPYVQEWAVRCLRPPSGADRRLDRSHLGGLAAAAAARAGVAAELPIRAREGWLHVPTVGALQVTAARDGTHVVRIGETGVSARGGAWHPVRRATSPLLDVAIEDLDPFRDCHDHPIAGRQTAPELDDWQRSLAEAMALLHRELPAYAGLITRELGTVVPLRPSGRSRRLSSTARRAFGAVALAPADADVLAELLVHEFQHVKLNLLMDVHALCVPQGSALMEVPWRPDPRPVEGALHGTYAFFGVAELWRARPGPEAEAKFCRYRDWVAKGLRELSASNEMTGAGETFVAGLAAAMDHW
ncbi:FxsB family radical SAM/SPASM domain protein [Actinomadura barringtoniae]|uniref:FxsB family radical SAM/SPASM domain protein n=1 Tax=Actinomadura barringtoniae TaxID=1427535 RepID=A0A939T5R7_9ACTN|nr:FxsB family cyclophane-forming radical SAM/SPASM peptide maturase [Actinomadura barringtoniae]MBO2450953.1 FxsB family radical SAM/SPASM domain protein [Actinomadura barringtoniae]